MEKYCEYHVHLYWFKDLKLQTRCSGGQRCVWPHSLNKQQYYLSVHGSRWPYLAFLSSLSLFLLFQFHLQWIHLPTLLSLHRLVLSLVSSISHFPPMLSSVSICSCTPPPLLSCHCCLLPLLSRSNYITARVSRLQILTRPSDEHFCPPLSRSGFRHCDLILDNFLKVDGACS